MQWLQAVERHVPGCNDSFAREADTFSLEELEALAGDLRNLQTAALIWNGDVQAPQFLRDSMGEREASAFMMKAKVTLPNEVEATNQIALRSSADSVPLGRNRVQESRARIGADRIQLYKRWFTRVEIGSIFRGNDTVLRGAVFHTDRALFGGADPDQRVSRFHLVDDGRRRGGGYATVHWRMGRLLLDTITPTPRDDSGALLWYRTVSAYLLSEGHLSEARAHLERARDLYPDQLFALLDSAYLHERLSSPAVQAAIVEVRALGTDDVAVESRTEELQNAERFLSQALALAPDNVDARVRLGHILSELGRHEDAMVELHRALEGALDQEHDYLAQLFLGRAAQALGRRDEAKRRYEEAAALYPSAQSPQLALAHLARASGDRAGALRMLNGVTKQASDLHSIDPWWSYYQPHVMTATDLMNQIRTLASPKAQ
jgi:tetratricopeptide (TPR) repeat protein